MNAQNDIAALIGSRICHDLISPLGAIGNGVELLGMAGEIGGPEMELISQSVTNANARIRFFRVAFGATKTGQMIGNDEVGAIIADINLGGRIQINWHSDVNLARDQVKLAFLLIQCFETAMPYGGNVTIRHQDDGWRLHCDGQRIKIDPALWELLVCTDPERDISPSNVHFAIVSGVAQQAGRRLQTDLNENSISLRF